MSEENQLRGKWQDTKAAVSNALIDARIQELRHMIATLNERIDELERQKKR
ncbi:MAG TPA: hypothetical protein VGF59_08180 [Bryobacteraceae bacterium]|jgi:uncharacterized protein YceH (UPF0502 family)